MSSVYFTATHKPYWYQRDTVQFISLQICEIQCVVKRWYKTGHWTLDWYRFHIFIVYFNHWAIVFFECPKMLHMPIMCTIWAVWVTKQWLMTFLNLNKHYIKKQHVQQTKNIFLNIKSYFTRSLSDMNYLPASPLPWCRCVFSVRFPPHIYVTHQHYPIHFRSI